MHHYRGIGCPFHLICRLAFAFLAVASLVLHSRADIIFDVTNIQAAARMIQQGRIRRTEGKKKQHFVVEPTADPAHTSTANGVMPSLDYDLMEMI